ncbi:MAG: putative ABC transporter permease [Candidatus Gracilibacteria bacterium]|jgi:uncharacterized membrane protein
MLVTYVIEFLFFGFVGWLLDSSYRLITDGRFLFGGYFRWVPIRPIYGLGSVILIISFKILGDINPISSIIIASLTMILLEYLSGIFTEHFLKIKLWDYSDSKFNIGGKIDLLHSFFWIFLVFLFYKYVFQFILYFESTFVFPQYLDLPVFWSFVVLLLFSTIKNHPSIVLMGNKVLVPLYIYDYHRFAILLKKYKRCKTPERKTLLRKQLQPYLKTTGISLKDA